MANININVRRIAAKLDDIFLGKIDVSDCIDPDDRKLYRSRALAALAIMTQCGIDETVAADSITDGYHDLGIDAIYCDDIQRKLFFGPKQMAR